MTGLETGKTLDLRGMVPGPLMSALAATLITMQGGSGEQTRVLCQSDCVEACLLVHRDGLGETTVRVVSLAVVCV